MNAPRRKPFKSTRTAKASQSQAGESGDLDTPLDVASEAVMEQLLAVMQSFMRLGLIDEGAPLIEALMNIVYEQGKSARKRAANARRRRLPDHPRNMSGYR